MTAEVDLDSDTAVIEHSRQTPEAFAVLYDRHAPAIYRYLSRRLGPDAADDLMAETFLLAFRQRDRYDPARLDARPWLYGIATNLIRQHWRREVRFLRAIARLGIDPAVSPADEDVTARVAAQGSRRELAAALARLNRGQRDVLLLTAWGELSPAEIGAVLKVATGTVHSRLNRARKKMREALGGIDPLDNERTS
ncbi:RNA polymerase sigma factor [Actinomadura rudentiformis]|uniref:RNA polymerase sigma factor n=1 Tax=Actinomadura rudentiformis TaxID=359158 RepID=A0A6H9YN02_9ACTN|nr:RNA polymerase sigma factor [Actinomadura rudentiformis]KAB2343728.1 RNA polymerase sigma factor [Actinomadura rudentiformis]